MSEPGRPLTRGELRRQRETADAERTASAPEPAGSVAPAAASGSSVPESEEADTSPRPSPRRGGVIAVLRAIGTGLTLGLLILFVGIGVMSIVVPAATGSTPLTVMTSSMEPTLPPGTLVVIRPTPVSQIKPGDIVTYQLRSGQATVVTHRVTQRLTTAEGKPLFITRGDNNPASDPDPVRAVQIRGKLWYSIPFVGWISTLVTGPTRAVVVPVVVGVLLAYAGWMVISSLRDRRRQAQESTPAGAANDPRESSRRTE